MTYDLVSGAGALALTRLRKRWCHSPETDSRATMVAELSGGVPALRRYRDRRSGSQRSIGSRRRAPRVDPAELTARLPHYGRRTRRRLLHTSGTTG